MISKVANYQLVIEAAAKEIYFEDFKTAGRLSGNVLTGLETRIAAFQSLESQGFVSLMNGRLKLETLEPYPWLIDALEKGDTRAWAIFDLFPDRAKKFHATDIDLAQIGLDGELYVMSELSRSLAKEQFRHSVHVSLTDDTAGFDIYSPVPEGTEGSCLEVKTTTRPSNTFEFYLSRNEWESAARLANWYLVLVMKKDNSHSIFGYLDGASLVSYFPRDMHNDFQWSTAKGKFRQDDLFQGLPGLRLSS